MVAALPHPACLPERVEVPLGPGRVGLPAVPPPSVQGALLKTLQSGHHNPVVLSDCISLCAPWTTCAADLFDLVPGRVDSVGHDRCRAARRRVPLRARKETGGRRRLSQGGRAAGSSPAAGHAFHERLERWVLAEGHWDPRTRRELGAQAASLTFHKSRSAHCSWRVAQCMSTEVVCVCQGDDGYLVDRGGEVDGSSMVNTWRLAMGAALGADDD